MYRAAMFAAAMLAGLCTTAIAAGDVSDSTRPTVVFPEPHAPGDAHWSIGLSIATLPRMLVEEEVNQSPMVDARIVYGLPWNITATGAVTTNFYVATHLSAGLRVGGAIGPVSAGVGLDVAWWFGMFGLSGFDNSVGGTFAYPSVSVGVNTGDVSITLRAELDYLMSFHQYAGDIEVTYDRDRIAGGSLGVYLEQPLWKTHHVMLGARINSVDFFYQSWMAFGTLRRRQLFPELFFAFLIR